MTVITNAREIYNEVPVGESHPYSYLSITHRMCVSDVSAASLDYAGHPVPGQTTVYDESEKIDVENCPLDGGFLVKTLYLSIEPVICGRLSTPERVGPVRLTRYV